jgi:antitoxin YefM
METTTFSSFRASLKKKLDKITDDHDVLIVNRRGNKDVVVMSLKDYNSMEETLYLLASKANASKLRLGIVQLKTGKVVKKSLKDL